MTTTVFENALSGRAAQKRRDSFEVYRRRLVEGVDAELDVDGMDELLSSAGELGFDRKRIDADTQMVRRARVLEARVAKAGGPEGLKAANEKTESLARAVAAAKERVRQSEKEHLIQYHARKQLGLDSGELARYQNDPLFTGKLPANETPTRLRPVDERDVHGRRPTAADQGHATNDAFESRRHRGGLPLARDR